MEHNRENSVDMNQQVDLQPNINLISPTHQEMVTIFNIPLTDEDKLFMKKRGILWNKHGTGLFDPRYILDSQSQHLYDIFDKIAERARKFGSITIGSFQEFLKNTQQKEQPVDAPDMIDLQVAISFLHKDAGRCTEEIGDDVMPDFLLCTIYLHERMAWMLCSFIENDPDLDESQKKILKWLSRGNRGINHAYPERFRASVSASV